MQTLCCVGQVVYKDDGKPDGLKSHGYCEPCAVKANAELDKLLAKKQKEIKQNGKVN